MINDNDKDIIISIGGSIVFPGKEINIKYLADFSKLIRKKIALENKRFFIFIGGGYLSHEYQNTAEKISKKVTKNDLNWLGIHSIGLNAHLLRTIFYDIAFPKILDRYDEKPMVGKHKIIICAAWLPGTSNDFNMVVLAKLLKIKKVYSLLNVAGIYDKDPTKHKDAKLIKRINWPYYREMIGDWWVPGRNVPFDPFASKLAEDDHMKVYCLEGKDLKNLENAFKDKDFQGSLIE